MSEELKFLKKVEDEIGRDGLSDTVNELVGDMANKLLLKQISVEEFLREFNKLIVLGKYREDEYKDQPISVENGFVYYQSGYETLKELALSIPDKSIIEKIKDLKETLERLIKKAKNLGDDELYNKLRNRLDRIDSQYI